MVNKVRFYLDKVNSDVFDDLLDEMKTHFLASFNEKIDIILLDCEGTESSDNIGTSKLYLINMLINSVIHIHVSKSIDQNFASKLSQALISSNKVIESLGTDIKEILPALYIMIKDTTDKAWENAKKCDPTLEKYEDLLKKYDNLYDYYNQFPSSRTCIVPPPLTDEEGSYIVNNKSSLYWKVLEQIFLHSTSCKKLKTRDELWHFIKNVATIINANNLMNVKSELESFYHNMFKNEKNKLLVSIIKRCISNFPQMMDHSPEGIRLSLECVMIDECNKIYGKSRKHFL